jgi:Domain of unknown function DUF29
MTTPDYDTDFYAWTQAQAAALRDHKWTTLDVEHLAEEIESLGRSDRRAIGHYLERLLKHLLKWTYQPEQRPRYGKSWARSIRHSRRKITELMAESPSLHGYPAQHVATAYRPSREDAADETDLPLATFPEVCPWPIEQVLDADFWPEG